MKPMFAEAIDNIPSDFWKNFCLGLIALLSVAGIIVGIWATLRKSEPQRLNDDPPIEIRKSPKRYNHDAVEQRFVRVEGQLTGHGLQLTELWEEMRSEDAKLQDDVNEKFQAIQRALGRIEGKLEK